MTEPNPWQRILGEVRGQVNPRSYDTWLAPTRFGRDENGILFVRVPTAEFRDWILEHYHERILAAAARLLINAQIEYVDEPSFKEPKPNHEARLAVRPALDPEIIPPEDLTYTHSIFLQCFMPLRHNPRNRMRWQADCGNASLVIRAGELVNPAKRGEFRQCHVPAGPKARIVAAYINDYAYRGRTPEIDLGESLREFMNRAEIPIGGRNGKEIYRELDNFAASEITLGIWHPGISAKQGSAKVASQMSFWRERDPNQRSFWQPSMTLSAEYFKSLLQGEHVAPIHWPGFISLQHNPRAMDIFTYLVYRLRKPLSRPVPIKAGDLHQMFGQDCKHLYHFWPRFVGALKEAHKHYPAARVEVTKEGLKLYSSRPLIPYRRVALLA